MGTCTASEGTSPTEVTISFSGSSVNEPPGRYYKCYLSATGASSQYSTANRGYDGYSTPVYDILRSDGDSDADYNTTVANDISLGDFPYSDTGAPASGEGRYYKIYLQSTGITNAYTAASRGFRISGNAPFFGTNF